MNKFVNKMKKYIIKYADGSEQNVMKAVHLSRKEAGQTLWDYLREHNDYYCLNSDKEDWVSPFDFIIKEEERKEVNEVITDFESARKALGLKPNDGLTVTQKLVGEGAISLKDVAHLVDDINPKHLDALIALNKLFTIAQAWNEGDKFVPDFSDINQTKYYPAFQYDGGIEKFTLCNALKTMKCDALCLNQICFKTKERADQFGEQFIDLFNKVLLIQKI